MLYALAQTRRFKYRLSLDIRRYFLSIHRPTLLDLLTRRLRDRWTIELIRALLEAGGRVYNTRLAVKVLGLDDDPLPPDAGLPIGAYLSQWSGGLYLDGLDHFAKRQLKVPAYARYQDDMVLFANDASFLTEARHAIVDWLAAERRLTLNRKRWEVSSTADSWVWLGYRISRGGLDASAKLRRRMATQLRQRARKGPDALARSLASYRGLLLFG
ncbi:MAG: RNA-directed DNA polymerase [Myxococcota bacterium]